MKSILSKILIMSSLVFGVTTAANAHGFDIHIGVPGVYVHPHYYHPYYNLNLCTQYDIYGNCVFYSGHVYHGEHYHNHIVVHHH